MENIFVEFLPPWVETGIQPAFYDKESGTVLQQTARMYARVNMLIRMFNKLSNNVKDLYDYVHDYFDNLDVQEEINNKLDQMAEDGSLYEIIRQYTDPIVATIDDKVDLQNANIEQIDINYRTADTQLQNQINALASGAPLVASSTSGMTDTSKIYVNTSDGKWYYYNGSAWTAGGTYQASESSTDVTNNTRWIKYVLDYSNIRLYGFQYGGFGDDDGYIYNTVRVCTEHINTKHFKNFHLILPSTLQIHAILSYNGTEFHTNNNTDVVRTQVTDGYTLAIADDIQFIRISLRNKTSGSTDVTETEIEESYVTIIESNESALQSTPKVIKMEYGGFGGDGGLAENTLRIRTPEISAVGIKNFAFHIPSTLKYNFGIGYKNNSWSSLTGHSTINGNKITIEEGYLKVRFNFMNKTSGSAEITEDELKNSAIEVLDLPTGGKKYVALGDSITYGYIPRNEDGYPGQLDSYAKLTAEKLGMKFVNAGISGNPLAQVGQAMNPMCVRYTSLDDDADIVTVMGGTNDIRNNVPLGTFDSRAITTFYGALHTLLGGLYKKYLIDQGTEAGTGKRIILITPPKLLLHSSTTQGGTGELYNFEPYINAMKEVAKYYSIPVLDMYNLSMMNPHLNQTIEGTDVSGWYNPYMPDGVHPNQEGAEIMSHLLVDYLTNQYSD